MLLGASSIVEHGLVVEGASILLRRGTPLQIVQSDSVPLMSSHARIKGPPQLQILAHRDKRQLCLVDAMELTNERRRTDVGHPSRVHGARLGRKATSVKNWRLRKDENPREERGEAITRTTLTWARRRTTTRRSRKRITPRSRISIANGIVALSSWSSVIKCICEQRQGGDEIFFHAELSAESFREGAPEYD
eukprot:5976826-Pleurochrysis_carterae.AAC.1